jgi:hypothetical protein
MKTKKNIGVWMDNSAAIFIDVTTEIKDDSVQSEFTADVKEEALHKNENLMHNKEQQMQEAYYNKIADVLLEYDHVLLFGPTNAKTAFHNFLNKDLHFKNIQIDIEPADKMTENEKHAFVVNHFKK